VIEIIVALIGALGIVLVALIGVFGSKINGRLRAVQGQVQNDHSTNLREELDARHRETRGWWRETRRDIGGIREELRGIRADIAHERERIDDIEDTLTTSKEKNQ